VYGLCAATVRISMPINFLDAQNRYENLSQGLLIEQF
jgi:hypothetical protein